MIKTSANAAETATLQPVQAVVFYEGTSNRGGSSLQYATIHPVEVLDGVPVLRAGSPLTVQAVKAVAKSFAESLKVKPEIIVENVLFSSDDLLVWWTPAQQRVCWFDIDWHRDAKGREALQGASGQLPITALVWMLQRTPGKGIWQGMHVYGLSESKRPTSETQLYRAPLLNINDDGAVCWGTGKVPQGRNQSDIQEWVDAFFGSTFTHYNQSNPFQGVDCYEFLAGLLKQPTETFPVEVMRPMKSTLGQVLAEHIRRTDD